MAALINRSLIEQTSFDSAAPSGSAAVAHRFVTGGELALALHEGDRVVEHRRLIVSDQAPIDLSAGPVAFDPGTLASGAVATMKVDLGPASVRAGAGSTSAGSGSGTEPMLRAGGHALFTAPPGRGRHVQVTRRSADGEDVVEFDSETLRAGDVFSVGIARPGRYRASNTVTGATATVVVTYPRIGGAPYRPGEPVHVMCGADGFAPAEVTVGPLQGLVFDIATDARITIDLAEPDDGPLGPDATDDARKAAWRRTRRPPGPEADGGTSITAS